MSSFSSSVIVSEVPATPYSSRGSVQHERLEFATSTKHLTFLTTVHGKPFTVGGFSGAFKDWCVAAGLPQCASHGLRKPSATRLAEAGCSPHQIMSITGHKSLKEGEVYTKAVRNQGLAKSAMARLK
jgi:integrase/recombinase XerD